MTFSWGWKWLAVVCACIAVGMWIVWPDRSPAIRIDAAKLVPDEGRAGDKVGLHIKGEWKDIPHSCTVKQSTRCANGRYLADVGYPLNLPPKPGPVNKGADGVPPREYFIPACDVPGKFEVTRTLTCERGPRLWRYSFTQPEATFSGKVLPP